MDIKLFRHCVENEVKEAVGEDIDPFSREYLLGNEYYKQRTVSNRVIGSDYSTNQIETVVNLLITPKERGDIFPSPYDLGSLIPLEAKLKAQSMIFTYLNKTYHDSDPSDLVKAIKKGIKVITGFPFTMFMDVDGSVAIKVLCTLYRYQQNYQQFFSLLQRPESIKKASFEFRDAYPLQERTGLAERNVSLIADLKSNLTFEMRGDWAEQLKSFFYHLPGRLENTDMWFELAVKNDWLKTRDNSLFEKAMQLVSDVLPSGNKAIPERLDKQLYIDLSILELEHRLQANTELFKFVLSEFEFEIHRLTALADRPDLHGHDYQPSDVRALVESALSVHISDEQFDKAYALSEAILNLQKVRCIAGSSDKESLIERVASIICIAGDRISQLRYKPYWKGQKNITGLLLPTLNKYLKDKSWQSHPEAHLEFWRLRYNYILHCCLGWGEVWIGQNKFALHLDKRLIECIRTNEFNLAMKYADACFTRFGVSRDAAYLG